MLKNIRFYILFLAFLYSIGIYLYVINSFSTERLQTIRLTQYFALSAVACLYVALLIGPLTYVWYSIPFRDQIFKARRAIGVSAFLFGLIHGTVAFFGQLGGFGGLGFLNNKYLLAISISFMALLILATMAATSFDWVVAKMKFRRWKMLHRLVYVAAILILIHAMMLGTHFADLSSAIPQIFFWAFAFLMAFELNRIDVFLKKYSFYPQFGLTQLIGGGLIGAFLAFASIPMGSSPSLGIHSLHIQMAKEAQQGIVGTGNPTLNNIPGLKGDRTKRYTVSIEQPSQIIPNQPVTFKYKIYDASSGNETKLFDRVYEKYMHMIVVDDSLNYFEHIHPDQTVEGFTITTQFPQNGRYHIYLDFQPLGAIEQQFAFVTTVGSDTDLVQANQQPDQNLIKTFGDYQIKLDFPQPLRATEISVGGQKLNFTLSDAATGQPITTLKPYLASFGHLVMINASTYDYLHVHPTNLVAPRPEQTGGPSVEFMPLGLYGPIKPGIYRVFGQFNPNGNLITADFTIKIE